MEFFEILLKMAYFFAAAPGFDFQSWKIKKSYCHFCYSFITAAANLIIAVICVIYNPKLNFNVSLPTGVCLYYARYISFAIQLVTVNLSPILHFQSWEKLVNNLQEVDFLLLGRIENLNNIHKKKYVMLFLVNLPFVLRVIMEEIIWNSTDGFALHVFFLYMNFNRYYCFASNIVMIYINVLVNARYRCMNQLLRSELFETTPKRGRVPPADVIAEIRLLRKLFALLSDVVKLYSDIFGYQIFFEFLYMHMAMLQRLVGSLVSNALATTVFTGNGIRIFQYLSLDGIIFNIVSTKIMLDISKNLILLQFLDVLIIISCDVTEARANEFQNHCYKMCTTNFTKTSQEQREMMKLVRFAQKEQPKFSAAGLFRINRKTFFGLFSTFATYFIIFAQFNSKLM